MISGAPIPIESAQIVVHQPTIREIALIGGEEVLFAGCDLLKFSKDILSPEDKIRLSNIDDFEIFMTLINEKSALNQERIQSAISVLELLFTSYEVVIEPNRIVLL